MQRRDFLRTVAGGACILAAGDLAGTAGPLPAQANPPPGPAPATVRPAPAQTPHQAMYYRRLDHQEIECVLCPRKCRVGNQERGYCGVRENQEGVYYTLVYNRPCSSHTDPVEKKPFYHFHPGSLAYSLATAGCNMNCKYCQNWETSQVRPEQVRSLFLTPQDCASHAGQDQALSIAYTYTEPVVFIEYMRDIAAAAKKRNLKNLMVSAGFVEPDPLEELLPLLDGVKIDLKAFSEDYYRDICRGRLAPVLKALQVIRRRGTWLEIVYLVLPTLNDSPGEIRSLCRWLLTELGPDVPIHFSRFKPIYLMKNLPPTPVETLERTREIALSEGLHFVYVGNVPGHPGESTYCPGCGHRLVHRTGYNVRVEALQDGHCTHCRRAIPGVWG